MKAATPTRTRRSEGAIRAELVEMGLIEEEQPIDGYGFTYWKHPTHAVEFYRDHHGGAEATRFYIAQRTYILSA